MSFSPVSSQPEHELQTEYQQLQRKYLTLAESPFSSNGFDELREVVKRMEQIALTLGQTSALDPQKQN